jgi:hypothetical protein
MSPDGDGKQRFMGNDIIRCPFIHSDKFSTGSLERDRLFTITAPA